MSLHGSDIVGAPNRGPILFAMIVIGVLLTVLWGFVIPGHLVHEPAGFGGLRLWDFETYFLPKFVFGSEQIRQGIFPLWNRFEFGGIPFLATAQPAAAYLPKIFVFALWEPTAAMRVYLMLHFALAALFFLWFMRDQRLPTSAGLLGALVFAFNAPYLKANGHPIEIANLAWLPLIFLFGDRFGRTPRLRWLALLALVVALQITAGYPQFVMDSGVLIAFHALLCWGTGRWKLPPWKSVPLLAGAFLFGALLAGVQLFPLAEMVLQTGRLGMAGVVASRVPTWGPMSGWLMTAVLALGLPGLLGMALVGIDRKRLAPFGGALFCVFMLLGGWKLLRFVPGFGAARLPGTWPLFSQFFLAWLVACGMNHFCRKARPGHEGRDRWRAACIGIFGLGWAVACISALLVPEMWKPGLLRVFLPPVAQEHAVLVGLLGAGGGALFAALGFARSRIERPETAILLAGLLVVGGHLCAFPFGVPTGRMTFPRTPYRSASLIPPQRLHEGRILSLVDARGGFHLRDHVENPFGREGSLPPPRFTRLEKRLGVVVQTMKIDWPQVVGSRALLDTLDVRFALAPRATVQAWRRVGFRPTGWGRGLMDLFESVQPLGRAWAVYAVRIAPTPERALDLLLSPGFDARRQVVLEQSLGSAYPAVSSRPATPARVRRPSPTVTEVEVDMEAAGILILADSCFPGWTVRVDGAPARLLCANYLVRGVELTAGPHRVLFEYRPASFRWGLCASLLALVGLLAFGFHEARARIGKMADHASGTTEDE